MTVSDKAREGTECLHSSQEVMQCSEAVDRGRCIPPESQEPQPPDYSPKLPSKTNKQQRSLGEKKKKNTKKLWDNSAGVRGKANFTDT